MKLDLTRFFQACNPSKTLVMGKAEDRQYYIDFSQVRGAKVIDQLRRAIARISPEDRKSNIKGLFTQSECGFE